MHCAKTFNLKTQPTTFPTFLRTFALIKVCGFNILYVYYIGHFKTLFSVVYGQNAGKPDLYSNKSMLTLVSLCSSDSFLF